MPLENVSPRLLDRVKSSTSFLRRVPQLFWIVLVAFLVRVSVIPFVYDEWMSPYNVAHYEQGNVARALLAGHGFGSPFLSQQLSAVMPPVFPVCVAFFFKILGVHTVASMIAVLAFNCLLSALACIPVARIARRIFSPKMAKWSAWGWALSPYGIYFSAEWAWSTHLLLLCLCWMIWLAMEMEERSSLGLWCGFGLLAGFAGLTEPSVLVVVPFLLALAVWRRRRAGAPFIAPALVASLALAAAIAPWMIRNQMVFHRFIPMRDSMGLEMYLSNTGESLHWRSGDHHPNHDPRELAEYDRAGELAFMDHKAAQAQAFIDAHRGWYFWMAGRRFLYLWTGYWSLDPHYLIQEPLDVYNIPVATFLSALGVWGIVLLSRKNAGHALRLGGLLFLYPLMYYFVHPEAYRMRPLDPFLVILTAYSLRCGYVWLALTARKMLPIKAIPAREVV